MYLSNNTRPYITVAVSILNPKVSCPTQRDWNKVKKIFKYLIGILNLKLCIDAKDLKLIDYSDADFVGEIENRKYTSGYVTKFCCFFQNF